LTGYGRRPPARTRTAATRTAAGGRRGGAGRRGAAVVFTAGRGETDRAAEDEEEQDFTHDAP
jgi:hypothetical protein